MGAGAAAYSRIPITTLSGCLFIQQPRKVGKTFLVKQVAEKFRKPQYINYDNQQCPDRYISSGRRVPCRKILSLQAASSICSN
jgi:hypothetical protein